MPRVFCPECLRGNNFKATDEYARCQSCRTNLYDHFIRDKDKSETDSLILEADDRRKSRDETERLQKLEEEAAQQRYWEEMARKESRLKTIKVSVSSVFVLACIWFAWGAVSDFFSEEAVTARAIASEERRIIREQERAKKFETEKKEFESRLARNYPEVEYLDLRKFAQKHVSETEVQNDATKERIVNNYYRMTGEVSEIDGGSKEKYGYRSFQIQIWEPMLFVTAECWAKSEADINKIASAKMGQRISISGKVWTYGDLVGLQLRNCSVL